MVLAATWDSAAQPPRMRPKGGFNPEGDAATPPLPRALRPRVFAIVGVKIDDSPKNTIVIRDGVITAVGPEVAIPADALRVDAHGQTAYPGLIDAMSSWGFDSALRRSEAGPPAAEDLASEALIATKPDNRKGLTPEFQVVSALKNDDEAADQWRRAGITTHVIAPEGGIFAGQSALVSNSGLSPREVVLRPVVAQNLAFRSPPGSEYPRILMGVMAHARQFLLDAQHYQRLSTWQSKNGQRSTFDPALDAAQAMLNRGVPVVIEADTRDEIHRALDFAKEFQLQPIIWGGRMAWKCADRLKAESVPVILRTNLTQANEEREAALTDRARLERNRLRHDERITAKQLHEAGVTFAFGFQGNSADKVREHMRAIVDAGLPVTAAMSALTTTPAKLFGLEKSLGQIAPGFQANIILADGGLFSERTKIKSVFVDGVRFELDVAPDENAEVGGKTARGPEAKGKGDVANRTGRRGQQPMLPENFVGPLAELDQYTEIETDRQPTMRTNGQVLIRGATVVTITNGTLPESDVLVRNGKIAAIGKNLAVDGNVAVIDAKGMYLMPGIIDTHSHFAVAGSVNESSLSVVPEVRIRDVIDGEDVQIYRALAGGVTTARILHGSANCIGGQDAVLKMKYGLPGRELIVTEGPRGVKFALGENVKRTDGRFPNTRLGVEAVLIRAFSEAQEYAKQWDEYRNAQRTGQILPEPRRDLRLEALADILRGDLKVHCHCYRADEILMLLRVADRFGFKIQSLQHVLEGYKIAPEIAAHGCSCSLFSDWWAYKIEAFDAIPYAAALLHEAGAKVVLKSDSNELMRHMYQEAAKCVKYGGLSPEEALKAITINAAHQLGLERRLGSIEIGKDGDLVLFNGHPLNAYARPEMTLIEGEVYFQRGQQLSRADYAAVPPKPAHRKLELPPSKNSITAIRGATVHPVNGPVIPEGTVVVNDGKIVAVGQSADVRIPEGAAIIPGEGLHVYPGLIDAGTILGLAELESARETQDFREGGDFQPDLRASIAVNPDSELIPVTRANGVLSVVTRPTGSMIAGQSALINLAGWVPREMAIVDPLGLHVELPSGLPYYSVFDPSVTPMGRNLARRQREERMRRLKDLFQQAKAYDAARSQASAVPVNPRLEALVPYAKGEKPVVFEAQRKTEIADALKFAEELKLKIVVCGAVDAWKLADELKRKDVPVIVGPTMAMPQERDDPFDAAFANPMFLHKTGVRFCIRSEGGSNARNLPYQAAMAVSYGLPPEEGLKSVTLYPAQILGVADQLGSIEVGKRANLVLTSGDILQATTQVLAIAIDGKFMPPESKQTRLYDRYRQRLQEVRDGKAILGTQ
jgi:imidazolonepropionase-like amidohydrolase